MGRSGQLSGSDSHDGLGTLLPRGPHSQAPPSERVVRALCLGPTADTVHSS